MATHHPETPITRSIIAVHKNLGGDAFHLHGSILQRGGEPDIAGEFPMAGRCGEVWVHTKIEVKTETGEPTARQLYRLNQYWKRGYLVGIVTSAVEFGLLVLYYKRWVASGKTAPFNMTDGFSLPYKEIYDA